MEYLKIANLLENTHNQVFKFRTKNWVEIDDYFHGMYKTNQNQSIKV